MEGYILTVLWGMIIVFVISCTLFLIHFIDRKSESIKNHFDDGEDLFYNEGESIKVINRNSDWELADGYFKRGNEKVKIWNTREWK